MASRNSRRITIDACIQRDQNDLENKIKLIIHWSRDLKVMAISTTNNRIKHVFISVTFFFFKYCFYIFLVSLSYKT